MTEIILSNKQIKELRKKLKNDIINEEKEMLKHLTNNIVKEKKEMLKQLVKEERSILNKNTYENMKNIVVDCPCGLTYSYYNKTRHENSKRHYNRINPETPIKYEARGITKKND